MLETFNALLRIGRIEAGARRAAFRPVDLAEMASDVVEAFRPAAEEEGKVLVGRLETPLSLQGDKDLLSQVADAVAFLVGASFVTGVVLDIDGGLHLT